MMHANDTHVVIDEQGVAVMSGTFDECIAIEQDMRLHGFDHIAVRPIDEPGSWDWTMVDWGDD